MCLKESNLAIVGGVNLIFWLVGIIRCCCLKVVVLDGCCKIFDVFADGYGEGEGCGMIVLKCFFDVIVDGDRVLVVIWGLVVNYDGFSSGLIVFNKMV